MEDYGNPFGATMAAPAPAAAPTPSTGNPFDPFGSTASSATNPGVSQQQPFAGNMTMNGNGYQQQPPPQTPQPQQYQQPQYQQPVQQQQPVGGYSQQPQQQQPQVDYSQNQLVVSSQQSNPYAGYAPAATTSSNMQQQAMVPATDPNQTLWALGGTAVAPGPIASPPSAASFDPFAPPPPAAAPAPPPVPPTPTPQQQQVAYPNTPSAASGAGYQDPFGYGGAPAPQSAPAPPPPPPPAPAPEQSYYQQQQTETQMTTYDSNRQEEDPEEQQAKQQYLNNYNDRQMVPSTPTSTAVTVRSPEEVRNKYSQELSTQAGPMASPLPKAELVRKKGYVLSRISFRTIVMKKWKQSFWIQYGSHTMLWFRNESDFDDWLNNPYHTQAQRNFLIKLAVNFVHDLYKPNVRGYQVTQCRTKPYGTKVVRQFKLERWMDYGPTIAAAFGSYDPKEVDACREAIVECMKNTPLDNGIRATGAVKEHHERQQAAMHQQQLEQQRGEQQSHSQQPNGGERYQNYQLPPGAAQRAHAQSMDAYGQRSAPPPSSVDLLGDFDDSASVPPAPTTGTAGDFTGALVPATNPSSAYSGAPPAAGYPQQYPGGYPQAPPAQQQQAYGAPPQQNFQYPAAPAPAHSHPQQISQQPQQQYPPAAAPMQQPQSAAFEYGGYQQQQPQQSQPGGYPMTSYPQPTQF